MNIEEAKAKITELTEEIQRLRSRDGVIVVRAEEKAGDEGLREFVVRIVERAKYLGHSRVDLPVRILEKALERKPRYPMDEQKDPAPDRTEELVKVLKAFPGLNCDTEDVIKWICAKEVILADFEKGAK